MFHSWNKTDAPDHLRRGVDESFPRETAVISNNMTAPELSRTVEKLAASIADAPNSSRQSAELIAKAI
jgi:hypothetical protein